LSRTAGSIVFIVAASLVVAAIASAWPASALAQCPLCRSAVEQAGDQTARTINLAIVVLLVPPVSIFCAIFAVAYKKSKGGDEQNRVPRPPRRY
jgi:heme/copper-type cytochrome/quinol oxidase subunit 2